MNRTTIERRTPASAAPPAAVGGAGRFDISMQHHALGVFSLQDGELRWTALVAARWWYCVTEKSIHVTVFRNKDENGPHLIVNARLRRAHKCFPAPSAWYCLVRTGTLAPLPTWRLLPPSWLTPSSCLRALAIGGLSPSKGGGRGVTSGSHSQIQKFGTSEGVQDRSRWDVRESKWQRRTRPFAP